MSDIFSVLWDDYCAISPQAEAIKALLSQQDDELVNDHIALRTIDDPICGIAHMAQDFLKVGYAFADDVYRFEQKHLRAQYLIHPDPRMPKVFISALCVDGLDPVCAEILRPLLSAAPADLWKPGRPWACVAADYQRLLQESEYAAWLLAFGWRANHFTVSVNHLQHYSSLEQLVSFLQAQGFEMNQSGALIKGSEAQFLKQASTRAAPIGVTMDDGVHQIPGCYVEFAERFAQADGSVFQGFIASSADKIFESTDTSSS